MHAEVIDEPELEFGGRGRHIDPRFGIGNYGPADLRFADAPRAIRVGLIGPADQLDGLRTWLERLPRADPGQGRAIPAPVPGVPRLRHRLGPADNAGLQRPQHADDQRPRRCGPSARPAADAPCRPAVDTYAAEITALADENRVDVLLTARPEQLADTAAGRPERRAGGHRSGRQRAGRRRVRLPQFANFHDLLKARTASPAAAHPDHPPQHLGRGEAAVRPAQPSGRGHRGPGTCTSPCTTKRAAYRGGCRATRPT